MALEGARAALVLAAVACQGESDTAECGDECERDAIACVEGCPGEESDPEAYDRCRAACDEEMDRCLERCDG